MSEKLKKCPFCGGDAVISEAKRGYPYNQHLPFTVKCGECHCALALQFFRTMDDAISAWNRRTDNETQS